MENLIKRVANLQKEIRQLKEELKSTSYWVKKAAKETDFTPEKGDWISVNIQPWVIQINVYHKDFDKGGNKYWINGEWFNHPFPGKIPSIDNCINL